MSDRETESFTPYEPQTQYDWDYGDEQPNGGGNILWGRLAALGAVLLITFFLGRASAPDGVDPAQLTAVQDDLQEAEDEIDELRSALEAQPAETPEPTETVIVEDDPAEDETFDGKIYVVQSGDRMTTIAERFCGDAGEAQTIADFNGLSDPSLIRPGQELRIPEDCGA
jgi:LysM repeat protein